MARSKPLQRRSPVAIVILVLVCSLIGGAILYRYGDRLRGLADGARSGSLMRLGKAGGKAKGAAEAEADELARMKRTQLEREVRRLREELAAKESENAEMKIQLKLLQEGSRTQPGAETGTATKK